MKILLIVYILLLTACANPGVVRLSPDTYMLYREDHAGIFGSSSSLKAGVIEDANAFAAKQNKVAIPISSNFKPMGGGPAQWASFEYQFSVVDKNDPLVRRTALKPRADIVIKKDEKNTTSINIKSSKDMYSKLIRLEDLRKKGILSKEEFEEQKKKILNNN